MQTDLAKAQADMRHAFCSGAAGMLASSLAWLSAAIAVALASPQRAVWVLFIGGMLIHPAGVVICKLLGRPGNHAKGNPLGSLAWASTLWLIFSLPLAYGVSLLRIEWFFPAMLLVIGGRFLVFSTLFGMRIFWVCGLALAGTGWLLGKMGAPPLLGALSGFAIEGTFAVIIFILDRREVRAGLVPA
jgi:hypothetical protein